MKDNGREISKGIQFLGLLSKEPSHINYEGLSDLDKKIIFEDMGLQYEPKESPKESPKEENEILRDFPEIEEV